MVNGSTNPMGMAWDEDHAYELLECIVKEQIAIKIISDSMFGINDILVSGKDFVLLGKVSRIVEKVKR